MMTHMASQKLVRLQRKGDGEEEPPRDGAQCPLCHQHFKRGTIGWDKHIGAWANHPDWHREIADPSARMRAFQAEFPDFFEAARTRIRQVPPGQRVQGAGVAPSKRFTPLFMEVAEPPAAPPAAPPARRAPLPREEPTTGQTAALPPSDVVDLPSTREDRQTPPGAPGGRAYKFCPHCGERLP